MKILLVCSAGMSTSMLVKKMKEAAAAAGEKHEIWAVAQSDAKANFGKADVILIGPQVQFLADKFKDETNKPIEVIPMRDYGTMNGEKVLAQAKAMK